MDDGWGMFILMILVAVYAEIRGRIKEA